MVTGNVHISQLLLRIPAVTSIQGFWLFMFLCVWCLPSVAFSQELEVIDFADSQESLSVGRLAQYYEDSDNSKNWEWVTAPEQRALFSPIDRNHFNAGYTDSSFWAVFQVSLKSALEAQEIYLEVGHPLLNQVEVFLIDEGQVIHHRKLGSNFEYNQRPINNPNLIFPLTIEREKTYQVYVRVKAEHSIAIPLTLYTKTGLMHYLSTSSSMIFAYFGMMGGLFFYNLFLFFFIKGRAYFYYLLYLGAVVIFQSSIIGFGFKFIWPSFPEVNLLIPNIFGALGVITACAFARNFLRVKRYSRVLDNGFWCIELALLVSLPFVGVFKMETFTNYVVALTIISFVWMILSSIYVLSKGMLIARYYLLAWTVMIGFSAIYIGYILDLLPYNLVTFYAMQIGSSLEAILLSIALADRINIIQKEKNELQKSSMESLETSNKVKDEFLATISHELRTPINGVQGALELIRLDEPDERTLNHVAMADESAHHMLTLIENILQFSEAQAGNLKIRQETFDFSAVLEDVEKKYFKPCIDKDIELTVNSDEEVAGIWKGDEYLLQKVVSILVENAIKFTKAGSIMIEAQIVPEQSEGQLKAVAISVLDSGIGIPLEQQESIFKSFKQLDASFSRRYSGLGIGLAVVKQITELMGGKVEVNSERGEGSRFTVTLPMIYAGPREANATDLPLAVVEKISGERRVLVVEDNLVNQTVLKGLLRKLDCQVVTAENGIEALKVLETDMVDLIFMDCQMPVMDGFSATQAIRNLPAPKCDIPIVAVTANATSKDRDKCIDSGMTDYMKKPVSMNAIEAKVSDYLGNSKVA